MRRLTLPAAALAACLLLAWGCNDDDTTSPPPAKTQIAILDDDSTETAVADILTAAGHDVTLLGHYWEYTDTDFSAYDLVFLLSGYEYGDDVADTVQQGLLEFVSAGGTLVTTEWITYSDNLALIIPTLPLAYGDDYCDEGGGACTDTVTVVADHPITAGLPATFTTPPDWTYSSCVVNAGATSTDVTVLLSGQESGPALAIGTYGSGHVLHWNMGGAYAGPDLWDANTSRILTNLAAYAR